MCLKFLCLNFLHFVLKLFVACTESYDNMSLYQCPEKKKNANKWLRSKVLKYASSYIAY